MVTEPLVWAIFFLPLLSFLLITLVIRPFFNRYAVVSGYLLILALAVSLALSLVVLRQHYGGAELDFEPHTWLNLGDVVIQMGLLLDPVTSIMLVVVSGVSLLIQIYSLGYMRGDPGVARYFAYMSLFTAAMLGLVLSVNVVQLYAFWELVGVSSYLLIGFWHDRPSAAAAAKKAFIVTRIGDVGFLLAIIYLAFHGPEFAAQGLNPLHIPDIWQAAQPLATGGAVLGGGALTLIALGIFAGAAGKSGQFPLHTWLPDAMEGPTPVSALIHAATMVAAGVFLVARFFPLFQQTQEAMTVVALIGGFTALGAATLGLVMDDIKRVMAYSTVSQLGYMMAALGIGAFGPALFHLFTHAFFKALLFLGAGSVNHASGTFNMRYMGGLRKHMPWTYALVLIAGLSLVGIIPLAGFWSKDEILTSAWVSGSTVDPWVYQAVFGLLIAGVLLTAFYTFRMIILTFHGDFRGGGARELEDAEESGLPRPSSVSEEVHLGESPRVMVLPMAVLGVAAILAGYVANPQWVKSFLLIPGHWFSYYVEAAVPFDHPKTPAFNWEVALISTAVALAGIVLAYLLYQFMGRKRTQTLEVPVEIGEPEGAGVAEPTLAAEGADGPSPLHGHEPVPVAPQRPEPLERGGPIYALLSRKYFMDELYEGLLVRRVFYRSFAALTDWFDRTLVDGLVDLAGSVCRNGGRVVAQLQTGQVQFYGAVIVLGAVLILVGYLAYSAGLGG
ncbi:MAG: NADH-quinone oxidoreductase subunit L [Chloroflexi bacterium]|nr:NADH-quinone oxidoreductase subunit L [Chloroflexota bacterium]